MMAKMLASIALVLAVALPAGAEHDRHDKREAKALAQAHRLEKVTQHLYHEVAERSRRGGPRQSRVVHAVHRLNREARDFRQELERSGLYDRRTRRDYRALERALNVVAQRLDEVRRGRHAKRDFAKLRHLVNDFHERFAAYDRRSERSRRHARHHRNEHDRGTHEYAGAVWSFEYRF